MNDKSPESLSAEDFQQSKVSARMRLLQMEPHLAQAEVDQVLYPQLWTPIEVFEWEDSIEPEYQADS